MLIAAAACSFVYAQNINAEMHKTMITQSYINFTTSSSDHVN